MPRTMEIVPDLMPELKSDLARLVAIPSISAPRYPKETHASLVEAYGAVAGLFRDAGARILDPLELPVGDESKWESPPFETAIPKNAANQRLSSSRRATKSLEIEPMVTRWSHSDPRECPRLLIRL